MSSSTHQLWSCHRHILMLLVSAIVIIQCNCQQLTYSSSLYDTNAAASLTSFPAPYAPVSSSQSVSPPTTYVSQLVVGLLQPINNGFMFIGSVTLIQDDGQHIIVDTPSATDTESLQLMLEGLHRKGLRIEDIDFVVTSHGHPDHNGQSNFFSNAKNFFSTYMYNRNYFVRTSLFENVTVQLTPNVQLWNTPGHTDLDISAIVRNVPSFGTVAVVGDLIYSAEDVLNSELWLGGAWNAEIGIANRNRVICTANYIVPGHGSVFRVTPQMRYIAKCSGNGDNDIVGYNDQYL